MKTKSVKFRALTHEDTIQKGDLILSHFTKRWQLVDRTIGQKVGDVQNVKFKRPIK